MRILVVSQYFPPDMGAPAGRFHDFAQRWRAAGHEVTVVTGLPHFPGGRIHEGYRGRKFFFTEVDAGIQVARCRIVTWPGRGGRPASYATFLAAASIRVVFDRRLRADVVIATSPPPTVGLPGLLAAWTRRVPLVLDVRDIWPEAIVQSGRLQNRLVIAFFESVARFLYRRARRITTVTAGWKRRLAAIGVPEEKIEILPNGVDLENFDEEARRALPPILANLDSQADWISYAGIFNRPQGLDIVLAGFARLREKDPGIYARTQLVLMGEGPEEAALRSQRARLRLERVVFLPRQPRSVAHRLLRRSRALLVTLRPRKDTSTVPSKLYECLASGRPVLYQGGGEGAEVVRNFAAGMVVAPGDCDALATSMLTYLRDPKLAEQHGSQGRQAVSEVFDRRAIAERFATSLESLVPSRRGP